MENLQIFTITDIIYTKNRQKLLFVKNRRNMQFSHDLFGKISKEMLILLHILSYKHVSCMNVLYQACINIFDKGKTRIMEFHQPPSHNHQGLWRLPLPIRHPQISMHIFETMLYRFSIDYIFCTLRGLTFWRLKKKIVWTTIRFFLLIVTLVDIFSFVIFQVQSKLILFN